MDKQKAKRRELLELGKEESAEEKEIIQKDLPSETLPILLLSEGLSCFHIKILSLISQRRPHHRASRIQGA